jgi:uncharacterized phage-associated protein
MQLPFNQRKTTQAASHFLKMDGGSMNYMKLIKLLYLTDRGAFLSWGRPVSGDKYYSVKLGPILSKVHDLITEPPNPNETVIWSQHISAPSNYEVSLITDPGNDELSRAEEKLIEEVFRAYGHYKPFDLVNLLHKTLPEWKETAEGRIPIEYREILQAGGIPPDEITAIESELDNLSVLESVLKVS